MSDASSGDMFEMTVQSELDQTTKTNPSPFMLRFASRRRRFCQALNFPPPTTLSRRDILTFINASRVWLGVQLYDTPEYEDARAEAKRLLDLLLQQFAREYPLAVEPGVNQNRWIANLQGYVRR